MSDLLRTITTIITSNRKRETYPNGQCAPSHEKVISLALDKNKAEHSNNLIQRNRCHDGNSKSLGRRRHLLRTANAADGLLAAGSLGGEGGACVVSIDDLGPFGVHGGVAEALTEGRDGLGENCCDGGCDAMHDG